MNLKALEYPKDVPFPYPFYDTGITVTATTYTGNPWDLEGVSDDPYEVRGTLFIRPSPFPSKENGGYMCSVRVGNEDLDVDPSTVKEVKESEP